MILYSGFNSITYFHIISIEKTQDLAGFVAGGYGWVTTSLAETESQALSEILISQNMDEEDEKSLQNQYKLRMKPPNKDKLNTLRKTSMSIFQKFHSMYVGMTYRMEGNFCGAKYSQKNSRVKFSWIAQRKTTPT